MGNATLSLSDDDPKISNARNAEKALKTLTMIGHSKVVVAKLPEELANAYFMFAH